MFLAVFKQKEFKVNTDPGCIGCGTVVKLLKASKISKVNFELKSMLFGDDRDFDIDDVGSINIYETPFGTSIDLEKMKADVEGEPTVDPERAEYERLKKKFEA